MQSMLNERPPTGFIVLSWNETPTACSSALACIERDLRPGDFLVFVDNGSSSQHLTQFAHFFDPFFIHSNFDLPTFDHSKFAHSHTLVSSFDNVVFAFAFDNKGPSAGRFIGLDKLPAHIEHVFLIDGDIVYVPGSADLYFNAWQKAEALGISPGCVGCNIPMRVRTTGTNGTLNSEEADTCVTVGKQYKAGHGIPIAWTQYGLFKRSSILRGLPVHGAFGEAGHGFEDDWLFQYMNSVGEASVYVEGPLYYHQASAGLRELAKTGVADSTLERRKLFLEAWPEAGSWKASVSEQKPIFTVAI